MVDPQIKSRLTLLFAAYNFGEKMDWFNFTKKSRKIFFPSTLNKSSMWTKLELVQVNKHEKQIVSEKFAQ